MFYLWNNFLFDKYVLQYWFDDKLRFFYQEGGLNQYISLGILLGIILIFYAVKCFRKPLTATVMVEDLENLEDLEIIVIDDTVSEVPIIEAVSENVKESIQEEIKEPISEDVKDVVATKPIKFIENPLPLPKKHVKKEMNYAFEPTPDQMHYDLNNYRFDDDYDLKDI